MSFEPFTGSAPAGNPETTVTNNPTDVGATTSPVTTTQTQVETPWYSNIQDENLRGFAENKKWQNVEEAIKSYSNLEQKLGKAKDAIYIPKDTDTPEAWNEYYKKIGVPDKAEEYGIDGDFAKIAMPWMKDAGISKSSAQKLAAAYNDYMAKAINEQQLNYLAKIENEQADLRKSMPISEYDKTMATARNLADYAGLSNDDVVAISNAIGYKRTVEVFKKLGNHLGEDVFINSQVTNKFGMSPEAASQKLAELRRDNKFMRDYVRGDQAAVAEYNKYVTVVATAKVK